MQIDGACHCGSISFTAEIDPARVMACHCTDCQVFSGSPFRVVVPTAIDRFQLRGEPKRYIKVAESGTRRVQAFCGDCGTPLFATAPENATQVIIRTGCVRQRSALKPVLGLWCRSAQPWLDAIATLPGSSEQQSFLHAVSPDAGAKR